MLTGISAVGIRNVRGDFDFCTHFSQFRITTATDLYGGASIIIILCCMYRRIYIRSVLKSVIRLGKSKSTLERFIIIIIVYLYITVYYYYTRTAVFRWHFKWHHRRRYRTHCHEFEKNTINLYKTKLDDTVIYKKYNRHTLKYNIMHKYIEILLDGITRNGHNSRRTLYFIFISFTYVWKCKTCCGSNKIRIVFIVR